MITKHIKLVLSYFAAMFCLVCSSSALALTKSASSDRIENIDMQISVQGDSSIQVTEKITFYTDEPIADICRDLSNVRKDSNYDIYKLGYRMLGVTVNSVNVDYNMREYTTYNRLHIGKSGNYLPAGTHEFTITYIVDNAISYGQKHDRLDWAINLDNWITPIDKARVTVSLPSGAEVLAYEIKTKDKHSNNYIVDQKNNGISFNSKRGLSADNSFNLGLEWEPGFVKVLQTKPYMTYTEGMVKFWGFVFIWVSFIVGFCYACRRCKIS